jgi:hypothetical protein
VSALLTPRRPPAPRRDRPRGPGEQAALFGEPAAAASEPAVASTAAAAVSEASTTAGARRQGPTLDHLVAGAWEGLLAGVPVDCPACGSAMAPRHSAGAGVVGGRCGGCGSTLS